MSSNLSNFALKQIACWGVIASSLFLFQCHSKSQNIQVGELVADSTTWNEKLVTITGYAVITGGFESPARIWASKEEAARRDLAPSVKIITLSEKYPRKDWRSPYRGRIRIWGTFRSVDYDPPDKLHLEEITRVDWLD